MKTSKRAIALFLTVIMFASVLFVNTSAASMSQKSYGGKYGKMIPVASNYKTTCKSYSVKGESGKLYFKLDSNGYKSNVFYSFAIFTDKGMKNNVVNASGAFPSVDSKTSITWNVANFKSGVYYGKTFTYIKTKSGNVIDSDSVYTFTITVNKVALLQPKITLCEVTSAGVALKWTAIKYAEIYRVYRKTAGDASYKKLVDTTARTFTDADITPGVTYIYTVRGIDNGYGSKYNKGVSVVYLTAPVISEAPLTVDNNAISLKWEKVEGAAGYIVYRRLSTETKYTRLTKLVGDITEYLDTAAKEDGCKYYYKVRAFSGITSGPTSKAASAAFFASAKISSATCIDGFAKIGWDTFDGANNYTLYKKTGADGEWTVAFESADSTEYIDYSIERGTTYYYSLVVTKNGEKSSFDTTGTGVTYLGSTEITGISNNTDNSTLITWNALADAKGYNIYRSTAGAAPQLVGTVIGKTKFYDFSKRMNNLRYTYSVEPFSDYSTGILSAEKSVLYMSAPELISAVWTDSGNLIKWKNVPGATSYTVYKRTPKGSWTVIGSLSDTYSFVDADAKKGEAYYYTVAAMNGSERGSYESGLGVNCLGAPKITSVAQNIDDSVSVKFEKVTGATGYYIYRKTIDGSWKNIGKTTGTTFKDTASLEDGCEYFYTVKAFNKNGAGLNHAFGVPIVYIQTQ